MWIRVAFLHDHVGRFVLHGLVSLQDLTCLLVAPGQHQSQVTEDSHSHQLTQGVVGLLNVNLDQQHL